MMSEKAIISKLDIRISISVLICCLTAVLLNAFDLKFSYGEMKLEVIQKMTACITCLICCQDTEALSRKSGWNRLIVTLIGGLIAAAVVALDQVFGNQWLTVLLTAAGTAAALAACKMTGLPYMNARIGGVTFILVVCTLPGPARIGYAVFRLISTIYAVLVVMAVTWGAEQLKKRS